MDLRFVRAFSRLVIGRRKPTRWPIPIALMLTRFARTMRMSRSCIGTNTVRYKRGRGISAVTGDLSGSYANETIASFKSSLRGKNPWKGYTRQLPRCVRELDGRSQTDLK